MPASGLLLFLGMWIYIFCFTVEWEFCFLKYLLSIALLQITPKPSSLKQQIVIISRLVWVRNLGESVARSGSRSLRGCSQGVGQGCSHPKACLGLEDPLPGWLPPRLLAGGLSSYHMGLSIGLFFLLMTWQLASSKESDEREGEREKEEEEEREEEEEEKEEEATMPFMT